MDVLDVLWHGLRDSFRVGPGWLLPERRTRATPGRAGRTIRSGTPFAQSPHRTQERLDRPRGAPLGSTDTATTCARLASEPSLSSALCRLATIRGQTSGQWS